MSKRPRFETTQNEIMSFISRVGVATQKQIASQNIIHATNLPEHMDSMLMTGRVKELPGRAYYYTGTKGRYSPVYQLTEEGAAVLKEYGYSGRPSGLRTEVSINHALAILDCQIALKSAHYEIKSV